MTDKMRMVKERTSRPSRIHCLCRLMDVSLQCFRMGLGSFCNESVSVCDRGLLKLILTPFLPFVSLLTCVGGGGKYMGCLIVLGESCDCSVTSIAHVTIALSFSPSLSFPFSGCLEFRVNEWPAFCVKNSKRHNLPASITTVIKVMNKRNDESQRISMMSESEEREDAQSSRTSWTYLEVWRLRSRLTFKAFHRQQIVVSVGQSTRHQTYLQSWPCIRRRLA